MNFAPLHNHSEYSALDGLATMREIAERCVEIGCPCCGITDHGTVAGHLDAARTFAKHGIKPIFGCELYHGIDPTVKGSTRDQAHFIAGAMTDEGLKNLWRLVNDSCGFHHHVGRITWEMLEKHNEGLFATSACVLSLIGRALQNDVYPDALDRYLDIFGDRFYIELHCYPDPFQVELNNRLVDIAQERGVGVVYATDAHFAFPDQYELHDAYLAMQMRESVYMDPSERKMWHPKALYIKDEQEVRASLDYLPESIVDEALANTAMIAEKADAQLPEVRRHLPAFIPKACPWLPEEEKALSAEEVFLLLVERGLTWRYGEDASAEVWERAEREIDVYFDAPGPVSGGGLEHYFLQVWDFCEFCNQNDIQRGPGRGSAAGSIIAYALGITDVDPLHYGLIFERFYNPGRAKGYPDIDTDFPKAQRKRVRQYLADRWGADKVAVIGTVTRMKPKSVMDKIWGAVNLTFVEKETVKKILNRVPDIDILGPDSIGWRREVDPGKTIYVEDHVKDEIDEWIIEDNHAIRAYAIEIAANLCSRVANYGIHPSGVVVSDTALGCELPCTIRGDKQGKSSEKVPATCFAMDDVDARLFVKDDLLGLRTLDTMADWEKQVEPIVGKIDWSGMDKEEWPGEMWDLLGQGFTLGLFQIEDGYGRTLCKGFKPRSVEDLSIIVALNRPGPIRSGAPDSFIKRRRGEVDDKFDGRKIPLVADLLEPTYGWFLYQEQVIFFFNRLGYDLGEADAVRKILGKKSPEQMRALKLGEGEWEGRDYFSMAEKAGLERTTAEEIWTCIEEFSKYSFNKSHSVAYAIIGFRTSFAKYFGMVQMIMASVRTMGDDPDKAQKTAGFISEGRRLGIQVFPPDILRSQAEMAVVDNHIYFGFSEINGIGKGTANYICKLRDKYDISTPEKLADAMDVEQAAWEVKRDAAKEENKTFKTRSPNQQFHHGHQSMLYRVGAYDAYGEREETTLLDKQKEEKELLKVILTDNTEEVFEAHSHLVEECDPWSELLTTDVARGRIAGVIATIDPKTTKKEGKAMGIVTIEYEGDSLEAVVFPQQWRSYKFLWRERTPAIFNIKKNERGFQFESAERLT